MINGKNYYDILGVSPAAEDEAIKGAYRALAAKYHPDKNPGNADAAQKCTEINEAYDTLKDPQKRVAYDRMLLAEQKKITYGQTNHPIRPHAGTPEQPVAKTGESAGFNRASEKPGFDAARAARAQEKAGANLKKHKSGKGSLLVTAAIVLGGAFLLSRCDTDEQPQAPEPVETVQPQTPTTDTRPQQPATPSRPAGPQPLQQSEVGYDQRVVICTPQLTPEQFSDNSYIYGVAQPQLAKQDAQLDAMKTDPNSDLVKAIRRGSHVKIKYKSAAEGGAPYVEAVNHTFLLDCGDPSVEAQTAGVPGYRRNPAKREANGFKARDFMFKPTSEFR